MSKDKEKTKKKISSKKDTCTKGKCKKIGGFVNIILFIILIAGLGWLGYTNGFFTKNTQEKAGINNIAQVEEFINTNGEMLFSGADFAVKSTEKEDGIWRSILEIKGQLQDFYMTTDGQIILGTETLKKILQSEKDEVIGDTDEKGILKVDDVLKEKIQKFISEKLVQPGTEIEVTEIAEEHGLIKVVATSQGHEQILHITSNGKRLVFGLISTEDYKKQLEEQAKAQAKASTVSKENKTDKPTVEYFVMSYCPYGTQFEKGLIPVIKLLGDKIDTQLKFVDYAMHEKKEIDENLAQYCIQKEQKEKLYPYLDCFLASKGEKADITSCIASTKINTVKLTACVDSTDKKFEISKNYKDKSTWKGQFPGFNTDKEAVKKYGVGGSPTFVINGETISSARDSQSLLKAICSGFKNAPAECGKKLSTTAPAAGFGSGKASSTASEGGCEQ
jgi:glutaredoxin